MKLISILSILVFVAVFITGFFGLVLTHEHLHQIILEEYGIESEVEYFPKQNSDDGFIRIATTHITSDNWADCDKTCQNLNLINEIVGYPFLIFYSFIGVLLLMIFINLEQGGNEK